MAVFHYSARGTTGTVVKGTFTAADRSAVITMIKNKGYIPLEVREGFKLSDSFDLGIKKSISSRELSVFAKQFGTVLEAGIPVLESLDIIRKQTESKTLKEILNNTYEQVQKGKALSEGLKESKDLLPPILINMIEAGEQSGTLDKVLSRLAIIFETDSKLINKVKGAMIYPAVIIAVVIIAVIVIMWKVIPQFEAMFASMGTELPWVTKFMIGLSNFIAGNIIFIFLGLVAAVVGFVYFYKSNSGKCFFDKFYLTTPPFSNMYIKLVSARFTRTMASLLSAGLPLIQSLQITDRVINNTLFSRHLENAIAAVTKGQKLSEAIGTIEMMPTMVISMVNIGEESGALDSLLDKVADFYEEETSVAVAKLTTMLEPATIIMMAVVVGGIVMAVAMPMFGMIQNVGGM